MGRACMFLLVSLLFSVSLRLISRGVFPERNVFGKYLDGILLRTGGRADLALIAGNSSCWKIFRGDQEAIEKARLKAITVEEKYQAITEMDYTAMTADCETFIRSRRYITFPLSEEEREFPLAYSMVINENMEMFERLLRGIYTPQNLYCVHVDRKSPDTFHTAVRSLAACFGNVFVARRLERVTYASWSRVQADLNCMEELLVSPVPWKYLINVCGKDFPIKTNREIVKKLKAMNGSNVIDSYSAPGYKVKRWKYHYDVGKYVVRSAQQKTPPPIRATVFVGSAYVMLTRKFVRNLFVQPDIQAFLNWSIDTYSPDEHIWATLQRMPEVPGSLPHTPVHHRGSPTALTRAVKWSFEAGDMSKGAFYPPCTGMYRHLICIYGSGDLRWILQQEPLFANKFDLQVDNTAVECMEEVVRNRTISGAETLI